MMIYKQKSHGFSLVEAMIVVAIVSILATMAVPSYQDLIERNRLKQAIEALKSDLQWMRTETIKKSCNLRASFTNGVAWSYQIYIPSDGAGTPCAIQQFYHGCIATVTAKAPDNCYFKTVDGSQYQGVTLDKDNNVTFSFRRGTAYAMGSTLSSTNYKARVVVGNVGRVSICNPDSLKRLPGYPDC